jgi:uncharacterized protein YceK
MRSVLALTVVAVLTGCASYVEKSSPCKRPANLSSYVEPTDCGPASPVNSLGNQAILNQIDES